MKYRQSVRRSLKGLLNLTRAKLRRRRRRRSARRRKRKTHRNQTMSISRQNERTSMNVEGKTNQRTRKTRARTRALLKVVGRSTRKTKSTNERNTVNPKTTLRKRCVPPGRVWTRQKSAESSLQSLQKARKKYS